MRSRARRASNLNIVNPVAMQNEVTLSSSYLGFCYNTVVTSAVCVLDALDGQVLMKWRLLKQA